MWYSRLDMSDKDGLNYASSAILDVFANTLHSDFLRSLNFSINNIPVLLKKFEKYTNIIHFDDINDKVMNAISLEYSTINNLDSNVKRILLNKKWRFTKKEHLSNVAHIAEQALTSKPMKNDFMAKVLFALYVNLFEEEMKLRLVKIEASKYNTVYKDIFLDESVKELAKFLVSQE